MGLTFRAPLSRASAGPLCVGFSRPCRTGREGGDLEVTVDTASGPRAFLLPWFFVRQVDALLELWRRQAHEATLLTMNGELGQTLVEAARAGGLRDVSFLLANGAEVNYRVGGAWTALNDSARYGHLAVVELLLDAGAANLGSALNSACRGGFPLVIALLLDRGATGSEAALLTASLHGHLEAVRLLLDRGVDIHAEGDGALLWARERGHEAVVALLLQRGPVDYW